MIKDTDGEHVDPINSILVVVPVDSVVAAQQRSGLIALMLKIKSKENKETVWASNQHKSPLQVYVLWMINMKYLPCLSLWAGGDRDVLRRQEENDAQGPCVHLGNGNSEDQDPGEEAGQGVDDHQKGISQQQPHVGGETMLHNKKYPTIDLPCSRN